MPVWKFNVLGCFVGAEYAIIRILRFNIVFYKLGLVATLVEWLRLAVLFKTENLSKEMHEIFRMGLLGFGRCEMVRTQD